MRLWLHLQDQARAPVLYRFTNASFSQILRGVRLWSSCLHLFTYSHEHSLVLSGRFCQKVGEIHCCLPCPTTDWVYPDNFNTITQAASWINVVGMACSVFLLLSFAALPVEKTHRHYLSICLAIGTIFMQVCQSYHTPCQCIINFS